MSVGQVLLDIGRWIVSDDGLKTILLVVGAVGGKKALSAANIKRWRELGTQAFWTVERFAKKQDLTLSSKEKKKAALGRLNAYLVSRGKKPLTLDGDGRIKGQAGKIVETLWEELGWEEKTLR